MNLEIDVSSREAVYEQIVRQVKAGVQEGTLVPGSPLPSIRQLADDLDLNHNTVAKAYKLLEIGRVIRTAGRKGTFVHGDALMHIDDRNSEEALYLIGELISTLSERGLSLDQIESTFYAAMSVRKD